MKNTNTLPKTTFKSFLANCYVEVKNDKVYNLVMNGDEETYVTIDISNGWKITEKSNIDVWNEAQRELLFCKIDAHLETPDTSDYEHPSISGGIYNHNY